MSEANRIFLHNPLDWSAVRAFPLGIVMVADFTVLFGRQIIVLSQVISRGILALTCLLAKGLLLPTDDILLRDKLTG